MLVLILSQKKEQDRLFLSMNGNLTKRETYKIEDYIIPMLKKEKIKQVICDCSSLKKIDFDGKYTLLKTKLILKKQKGTLLLCDVKKSIKNELIGYRMRIQTR